MALECSIESDHHQTGSDQHHPHDPSTTPPCTACTSPPSTRPRCSTRSTGQTNHNLTSPITSAIEGLDLGEMERVWQELAASEMRLQLMDNLEKHKVGLNDVEYFNLGLKFNAKTEKSRINDDRRVVEAAMGFKRRDEVRNRRNLVKNKLELRKIMERKLGKKSNAQRRLAKHLNDMVKRKKEELSKKYDKKIEHLRMKFGNDDEKEIDKIPDEMGDFREMIVLDKERYEKLEVKEPEVVKYGDVELDDEEKAAMRLHPKMALPKRLQEGYMSLQQDLSYTKVRWQLRKEEEEETPGDES